MFTRFVFCLFLLFAYGFFTPKDIWASDVSMPNIVVILADDIGVGDISYYTENIAGKSAVVNTSNIDSLAEQGLWFSDAHSATALCAPTRYAVMTGKNNYRSYAPWGVWGSFQPNAINDQDITLANAVKSQGYVSGFVGKWHLGGDFLKRNSQTIYRGTDEGNLPNVALEAMVGGGPNNLGFDYSFMLPDGIQGPLYLAYEDQQWYPLNKDSRLMYFNEKTVADVKTISDKGDGMADSHWSTPDMGFLLADKAADFIHQNAGNRPFFLYYASPMAHLPHMPPEKFNQIKVKGQTPSDHLDMVLELDLQVGHIIDALKANKVYENTLIIFTSDNGGLAWGVPGTRESGHQGSGIFRGSKNQPYEGGHRVPFVVTWPAILNAPGISDAPVMVQDILATIAVASGKPLAAEMRPDSKSFLPLLQEQDLNQKPYLNRDFIMLQAGSQNQLIYREGPWKLIIQSNHKLTKYEPVALFNLRNNLSEDESRNLIGDSKQQSRIDGMLRRYRAMRISGQPTG